MSQSPAVTVLIPFYNEEKFLPQAVESVLKQSFTDWELFLIDDGSGDKSSAMARDFEKQYPNRIYYLEHEGHGNKGWGGCHNLGISRARGRYVGFLDADDVWLPNKLAEQVALLDKMPDTGMVYGPSKYWYSWSGLQNSEEPDFIQKMGFNSPVSTDAKTLLPLFLRAPEVTPVPASILVRRDLLVKVGGPEPEFRGIHQAYADQVFYVKIILAGKNVYFVPETYAFYRQHPQSACAVSFKNNDNVFARLKFLNWVSRYIEKYDSGKDKNIRDVLSRELNRSRYECFSEAIRRRLPPGIVSLVRRCKRALTSRRG